MYIGATFTIGMIGAAVYMQYLNTIHFQKSQRTSVYYMWMREVESLVEGNCWHIKQRLETFITHGAFVQGKLV